MKYIIDHDLHIHSFRSPCSRDSEQNPDNILKYGIDNNFKYICLTDHLWDKRIKGTYGNHPEQYYDELIKSLPLPFSDSTSFYFGCETDMDKEYRVGISYEVFNNFDFVIISTTHLQLSGYTINENASLDDRAGLYVSRLESLSEYNFNFRNVGLAHPVSEHICPGFGFSDIYRRLDFDRLFCVLNKLQRKGIGIEINSIDFNFKNKRQEDVLSIIDYYDKLKKTGFKFYLGSDSHHPDTLKIAPSVFRSAIDVLNLTESDKFIPEVFNK